MSREVRYVVKTELDPPGCARPSLTSSGWVASLDPFVRETVQGLGVPFPESVVCLAIDSAGREVGFLVVIGEKIDHVEVAPQYRRQGIATGMLRALKAAGYPVTRNEHPLFTDDGRAWAQAIYASGDLTLADQVGAA